VTLCPARVLPEYANVAISILNADPAHLKVRRYVR
jgi:hypothetical protein